MAPKKGVIIEIPKDFQGYSIAPTNNSNQQEFLNYHSSKVIYSQKDGLIVGEHQGAHYFTKGQRKGLSVGGTVEPLFVLDTDVKNNIIYTGQGKSHPGLYRRGLLVKSPDIHWVREDMTLNQGDRLEVQARIRYRQPLEEAKLYLEEEGLFILFEHPQSAIAEGQFVAWYNGSELLGSGVIS